METVIETKPSEWITTIDKSGLDEQKRTTLVETFTPFFAEIDKYRESAHAITVTDVSQVAEMKQAREMRLRLVKVRTGIEEKRKTLKEQSLRESQMIDAVARVGKLTLEETESYLEKQERFAEMQEEKRLTALASERSEKLQSLGLDPTIYDLRKMSNEGFDNLYEGTKLRQQQERERIQREEEQRVADARKRAEEEQKMREENERLKKEREEQQRILEEQRKKMLAEKKALEVKAEKVRKEQEARLRREREERERIQKELDEQNEKRAAEIAKQEQEERERIRKQKEAEKKAANAPDKQKLLNYAKAINLIPLPELKGLDALTIGEDIAKLRTKFTTFINEKAETL